MLTAWDLQAITGPRPTGLGYAVRLLLNAYSVYGGADGGPAEVAGLRPNTADRALRGVPDRLLWEQYRLPRTVPRAAGLLYCPALGPPLRCPVPRVAHVHDLIPLSDSSQFRGVSRWYWTRLLPAGWRRCAALTVSNSSLVDEVAQRLGYPRGRIHVVPYYALLPASAAPSGGVPGSRPAPPYFLTLASHEPRKNLGLAIRALASLSRPASPARLVCLGGQTPHTAELQRLAQHLGVATRISWVDYLDRAATLELLRGATALLFVSTLEGYGMPPQEAQALGAPVVLSDIPCHRAVYADPQRWQQVSAELREPPPFVATDDAEALGRLMQRLLDDPQWHARLSSAGLAYQSTFSPRSTAAALRTAFAAALES